MDGVTAAHEHLLLWQVNMKRSQKFEQFETKETGAAILDPERTVINLSERTLNSI